MMSERGTHRECTTWHARRFCAGCGMTRRSSRSAGSGTRARWVTPGGWRRPTGKCARNGCGLIERSTERQFFLRRHGDVNAAKAFLRKARKGRRGPAQVTLGAYAASHRAVADPKETGELPEGVSGRGRKYRNNLIEQDHRRIKQRLGPLPGRKSMESATIVRSGIELAGGPRRRCRRSGDQRSRPD